MNGIAQEPTPAMIEAGSAAFLTKVVGSVPGLDYGEAVKAIYLAMEAARIPTPTEDVVEQDRFPAIRHWFFQTLTGPQRAEFFEAMGYPVGQLGQFAFQHAALRAAFGAALKEPTKDRETDRDALLRELTEAVGETLDKDFDFWSKNFERRTRLYRAWSASSASQRG